MDPFRIDLRSFLDSDVLLTSVVVVNSQFQLIEHELCNLLKLFWLLTAGIVKNAAKSYKIQGLNQDNRSV